MPRFLLETPNVSAADHDRAAATASMRFPEVAIEQRLQAREGRDIWVCRAPSAAHVRRWAVECGFALAALDLVDIETAERTTR